MKFIIIVILLCLCSNLVIASPLLQDVRVNSDYAVGMGLTGIGVYVLTFATPVSYISGTLLVVGGLTMIYGAIRYEFHKKTDIKDSN